MDHLIDNIDVYIDIDFEGFYEEWKKGEYKLYSDVPGYNSIKALIDSGNILRKHIGWELRSIKKEILYRED